MFEIASALAQRLENDGAVAIATIVGTSGSAPRPPGVSLAVTIDGGVIGSISAGCVDGAVYELCLDVLRTGAPQSCTFGPVDSPFATGLTCGGSIDVIVTLVKSDNTAVVAALRDRADGASARVVHVLSGPRFGALVSDCDPAGTEQVFIENAATQSRILVFGANDFGAALADVARAAGFRVTVCDPRPVFASSERFRGADDVVVAWPPRWLTAEPVDDRTAVAILGHDERFDADLIAVALRRGIRYVGAMGSRSAHTRRVEQLRASGIDDLTNLRSPIGLDLGAVTPEEVAISILAEIIANRTGATGRPLRSEVGRIHRRVVGHPVG